MIGALGPIIRGDHRKRSRNAQIDMEYDTMLCGHWHQLIQIERLIVNGSLKGYDEYAYSNNSPSSLRAKRCGSRTPNTASPSARRSMSIARPGAVWNPARGRQ